MVTHIFKHFQIEMVTLYYKNKVKMYYIRKGELMNQLVEKTEQAS